MLTNLDMITKALNQFEAGDHLQCEKTLKSISSNFTLDDDEFDFSVTCEIREPYKEVSQQLIESGQAELIGDESIAHKKSVRIQINSRSKYPVSFVPIDEFEAQFDDEISTELKPDEVYFYSSRSFRLDEGEATSVSTVVGLHHIDAKAHKNIIDGWLKKEFGKVEEW